MCNKKNIGTCGIFSSTLHLFLPTIFLSRHCHHTSYMTSYNSSHLRANSINFSPISEDKNRQQTLEVWWRRRKAVHIIGIGQVQTGSDPFRHVILSQQRRRDGTELRRDGDVPVSVNISVWLHMRKFYWTVTFRDRTETWRIAWIGLKTVRVGYCSGLVNAIRRRPNLCSCSQIVNNLFCSSNVNSTAESKRVTWINYLVGEVCAYFACRAAPCHVAQAVLTQVTAARGSRRPSTTDRTKSIAVVVDSCGDGEEGASRLWDALEESLAWAIQCATGSTAVVMIVATSTILQHKSKLSYAANKEAHIIPKIWPQRP